MLYYKPAPVGVALHPSFGIGMEAGLDFQKITAGLVILGGSVSSLGSMLGLALGKVLGTPRDACGWQLVQPTRTPEQINAWIQGTPLPLYTEKVQAYLGDCSGPDPWLFAMLGAIPGVILFVSPLIKKS
jgi:hypothetical protein